MRYTRRRWDVTVLLMGLALGLGLGATELLIGGVWPKGGAVLVILIPFALFRFRIPKEGFESPNFGDLKLPRVQRYFIAWCVFWLIGCLCAIPFIIRSKQHWWWALASVALMAFTLAFAGRVDRARQSLLKGTGDDHDAASRNPSE
jgi:hypothetical protein